MREREVSIASKTSLSLNGRGSDYLAQKRRKARLRSSFSILKFYLLGLLGHVDEVAGARSGAAAEFAFLLAATGRRAHGFRWFLGRRFLGDPFFIQLAPAEADLAIGGVHAEHLHFNLVA